MSDVGREAPAEAPRQILRPGVICQAGESGPRVLLIEADPEVADESALRTAARAAASGAAHVSRSYRYPYALVAWHEQPLGVDIERVTRCELSFASSICTPAEALIAPHVEDRDLYFTSMWSSKEAIAKGLGDALRYDPRRIGAPMLWPQGRAGSWRSTELVGPPRHVLWLCWREEPLACAPSGAIRSSDGRS